jgi:hypothetical protein
VRKDGQVVWVSVNATLIRDEAEHTKAPPYIKHILLPATFDGLLRFLSRDSISAILDVECVSVQVQEEMLR